MKLEDRHGGTLAAEPAVAAASALPPVAREPPPRAPAVRAMALGLGMARARVLRRPALLSMVLGLALIVTSAVIERGGDPLAATDRALATAFRWIMPFVVYGVVGELLDRKRLADSVWPLARYGLAKRDVALGLGAGAATAGALVAAVFGALTVVFTHARHATISLGADAATTAWIGALTGAAFAAWFVFGATFGQRGRGRLVVLVAHVFFGGMTGVLGALLPHAHARNLLGFAAPLHLTQPASAVVLAVTAVALTLLAALRCRT